MKKLLSLLSFLLIFSCAKDDDLSIPGSINPDPNAGVEVQDFMWKAMNYWYFWQADVSDLADDRFINSEDYTAFLVSETDPGQFFDNKLLFSEDRFSIYKENYKDLTNALSGISRSNGVEFGLVGYADSDDIFGYVRYIIPNSDASTKDISRGELFTKVDGITLNNNNYIDLLFGENNTYTLTMATMVNGIPTESDKEVSLTKQDGLAENPIFLSKSFEINGEKIGYLVYNGFTDEYDEILNEVFSTFKTDGITNLVLDLRYNPGGDVNTTRLLGSMIFSTNTDNLFLKKRYNAKIQPIYTTSLFFANKTPRGSTLNTLSLSKVYILTTKSSASASELLINCLEPYIDVVHIGETTRGKNEFSATMVDDRGNSYIYNPARVNKINPDVQWGLQPLIGRNENADGFSDYTSGLVPDIELKEDLANLSVLGDQNEPLLARAIQEISGTTGKKDFTVQVPAFIITSSKMFAPLRDNMYDNSPIKINLE